MKIKIATLGWNDAVSLLALVMLMCREFIMLDTLATFAQNLKTLPEFIANSESDKFATALSMRSLGNITLVLVCIFSQIMKKKNSK